MSNHPNGAPHDDKFSPSIGFFGTFWRVCLDHGQVWMAVASGFLYILVSTLLISSNKFLMSKERFPFPLHLVIFHMMLNSGLMFSLMLSQPRLFPALRPTPAQHPDLPQASSYFGHIFGIARKACPVAVLFAFELIFGNAAFEYSSVQFIQMMKESTIVWVYSLSVVFCIEDLLWAKTLVVLFLLGATIMTLDGEAHFDSFGFVLQGLSIVCASMKCVLQATLLTGRGIKLDVLSYVAVVTPLCFAMLGAVCFVTCLFPGAKLEALKTPSTATVLMYAKPIILSGILASALNVTIASYIKYTSAVSFVLTGIVKDMAIVVWGAAVLGESIGVMQAIGFALQIVGVFLWCIVKTFPDEFHNGIIHGLFMVFGRLGQRDESKGELNDQQGTISNDDQGAISNDQKGNGYGSMARNN